MDIERPGTTPGGPARTVMSQLGRGSRGGKMLENGQNGAEGTEQENISDPCSSEPQHSDAARQEPM